MKKLKSICYFLLIIFSGTSCMLSVKDTESKNDAKIFNEADFEVMDQICVSVSGSSKVVEIVKKNEASIKEDVLATSIVYDQTVGFAKEWKLNEEVCTLGVEKQ